MHPYTHFDTFPIALITVFQVKQFFLNYYVTKKFFFSKIKFYFIC